ncbi:alpha/beta hydrolase [Acetivibrio cellulolyticus]|uniref:alpha/beta hydrolase n=1 Tax=Acetivibrio cellulolyticus TaxID=35830 RepID=UPI0001E2C77A|nr:alpha/beta fold hydrolase [Acetivibrio cellulolyticus]
MRIEEVMNNNSVNLPNYEEILIPSSGTQIALSIWKSDSKSNPNIVFIAGTMTHPLFYSPFLNEICKKGYNVIGVHHLSHGKSPREIKAFTIDHMIANVKDTITYVIKNFNDNVGLMGSSQGGVLSISLAGLDNRIKAVFPHNILLTSLKESIKVTRFPNWLTPLYNPIIGVMKLGAKIMPKKQLAMDFYLDADKVFSTKEWKDYFYTDPIGMTKYPISFLASLFACDMTHITDGSIKCPVVVLVSKGDPLFVKEYSDLVYEKIKCKTKEKVEFDIDSHLIFNECLDSVIDRVVEKLDKYMK